SFADDANLLIGSYTGSALTSYKRDFYPVCQSQSLAITQNTATAVGLPCADRNGDALSYETLGSPVSGGLGAIDQANARVFYHPFTGYLGADAFRYRATADGLVSNEATASVSVVPPVVAPPVVKPKNFGSIVTFTWGVRHSILTIKQLVVRRLPVGATV